MTIFDYTSLPTITVSYILRDADNPASTVTVTNQETKESVTLTAGVGAIFSTGSFTVDVTDIIGGINDNTTLLVAVLDTNGNPIYRDIVVFDTRLDTESDYEENDTESEYIFVE